MNIPVFLASDNNYAPFVATTIASICDNTKSFIDFYILDGGITKENQAKIEQLKNTFNNFSIEFLEIDEEKEFASIDYQNMNDYVSLSTYNRFLIPQLKPEIDRAIYSDVDVIILDDIVQMYNENLNGHILGAVWEEFNDRSDDMNTRRADLNLADNHKYFSAGNLLIDCKKWRKENTLEKLFTIEKQYRDNLKYADMDVLNKYFDNNYQNLDKKYCYIGQNFEFYNETGNITIRHYNGKTKPWHIAPDTKTELMPNLAEFWHYAKMTAFYDEIYQKTQDKAKQAQLLRYLQIAKLRMKNANNK